jgi:hypothetical protein
MSPETTRRLLKATLVVSLLELVLLRVLSRLAMHIPRNVPTRDLLLSLVSLISSSGIMMYYISYLLSVISLFLITWQGLKHPQKAARMTSFLILFVLMLAPLVEWMPTDTLLSLAFDLASLGSISLLSVLFLTSSRKSSERTAAALFGLSYLSFYYFKTSHALFQFWGITASPPFVTEMLGAGELFVVINGLVLFIAHPRPSFSNKNALILSSTLTMLYISTHFLGPYAVSILAIWSLGLRLYLPFVCYAVALWLFSYTVLDRLWKGENIGYGLTFIFIAGFTVSLPHQVLKALLGLALLGLSPPISGVQNIST